MSDKVEVVEDAVEEKVEVQLNVNSWKRKAGERVVVDAATAQRLVANGQASVVAPAEPEGKKAKG